MPKVKTNRSAAKRFNKTGSGAITRSKAGKNHFTGKKASKSIRNLRKGTLVSSADEKRISKIIPYK
ncbi:large subunit ribosomal protein L35 [Sedimentibacter acidaminivorans]|jgi:large subunit ribosomal protein L35|uniref:Large ribosomal subunit protein bL35 n=1 Tax=Sedimentibacter acidaminivorans TaxID=913099 RepID=A0ABS4G9W3_9FIRM|nr:50S ribosomal protein L35 [Sedimentibacter acidaminivorans]MBP1924195.1 large subunit ribosomal protein L35 [Sedimentibacter acidaminivorans]